MILCALVTATEWAVRHTAFRHGGTALLVIVAAAIVANIGLLPAGSSPQAPVPVYEAVLHHVAPLSIFWLLLRVDLRHVARAGLPILLLFGAGAAGTILGVMVGFSWLDTTVLGEFRPAIAGMFAATYVGGSVNFTAVALHYDVVRAGHVYAATVVVDNVLTALWMVVTLALPRILASWWPQTGPRRSLPLAPNSDPDSETIHPLELSAVLGLGVGALWAANFITAVLGHHGWGVAPILVITVLALVLAQLPVIARLHGARVLGMFSVYLFLAVIGAFCDVEALARSGELGLTLLLLATVCVLVHGLVTLAAAMLLGIDPATAAVASQANVGGGTSALALARSLGRDDLVLPALLVGALGNGVGTFFGFWIASALS